jgi:hypothetical protein
MPFLQRYNGAEGLEKFHEMLQQSPRQPVWPFASAHHRLQLLHHGVRQLRP